MASNTVNKLRFMAKVKGDEASNESGLAVAPESDEKWSYGPVETSRIHNVVDSAKKLTSIGVFARYSFGGANPHIEQWLADNKRAKKQKREKTQD